MQTPEQARLARLIVEALNLDDVAPGTVDPVSPLFGNGAGSLGLDSIDALEIALAVQREYGVELRSEDPATRRAFASLAALAEHLAQARAPDAAAAASAPTPSQAPVGVPDHAA